MKNQNNMTNEKAKKIVEQSSNSAHISQLSLSEMSQISGGLRMPDGSYFGDDVDMDAYLAGKVNWTTGKPGGTRFGDIDDYPYKPSYVPKHPKPKF